MDKDRELIKAWFLKKARNANFKNIAEFARAVGLDSTKMSNIFSGLRRISAEEIDKFAAVLNVTPTEIRTTLGETIATPMARPLAGYVGMADSVVFFEKTEKTENIRIPFYYYGGVLLEVRGESMGQRFSPGDILGITIPPNGVIDDTLVGRDVVACLEDGSFVLKVLHNGSQPRKYTLLSLNPHGRPIIDAGINWVAGIDFIIPKLRIIT